jgi:hypothetical protein
VGPGLLYDELNHLVARQCVLLPDTVLGVKAPRCRSRKQSWTLCPRTRHFGRKRYLGQNGFNVVTSVVLMGTDRTSIHDPQYCLEAASWHIEKTEEVLLPMDRPILTKCRR